MRTVEFAEFVLGKEPSLFWVLPDYLKDYINFINSFLQSYLFRIKRDILLFRLRGEATIWQVFSSS